MVDGLVQKKWTPVLIKRLRGKRTQDEFAKLMGAPKNTIWRWEAGQTEPAAAYARKLSQIAAREQSLLAWQPIGSITWVGDLDAGAREIELAFSPSTAHSQRRPAAKSGTSR